MSNLANWIQNEAKKEAEIWKNKGISKTKARKFYAEVKRIERKLKTMGDDKFEQLLPEIKLIIPKAVYDAHRDRKNKSLSNFIKKFVEKIENPKDFREFAIKFEAVIGFADLTN